MGRVRGRSTRQRTFSRRVSRLVSYTWIVAALSLPLIGAALLAQNAITQQQLASQTTYVVQRGDTLNTIAARYSVSLDELVQANGLANPNVIYAGQTLVIPRQDKATGGQLYTIQQGESLAAIARRYGVTVDQVLAANNMTDRNAITAGQQITIPTSEDLSAQVQQSVTYTMQRGDSLYRVSLVFGVTVDDLLAANSLASPNAVFPGLVLRIPAPGSAPVATQAPPDTSTPTTPSSTGGRNYTVRLGDTLTQIAIQAGVTVDGLLAANGLSNPNSIYAGQVLNVPDSGGTARAYPAQTAVNVTVKDGDSLSAIAMKYGVTVQALAVANGILDASRIAVGQVISIPSAQAGSSSVRYASVGAGLCEGVTSTQVGTGYFIRPTTGYVISQTFLPWHSGIDMAANIGTLIFAADSGTVIFAGWNSAGYGNLTVLDHGNGWRTYYGHQSEIDVKCGDWVPRGSIIGKVGSTGNSTGPHLHFEMLRFGISVNPAGYVAF